MSRVFLRCGLHLEGVFCVLSVVSAVLRLYSCPLGRKEHMRRKDQLITNAEAFSILEKGEYGILSTVSPSNEPYGVPLNYCLIDGCIFFHCGLEGRKIDNITNNHKVSFCVVGNTEVLPDKFSTTFESCIVQGCACETFSEEKQMALEGLVHKYSESFTSEGIKYIEKFIEKTRVFKITIDSISGKAKK